MYILFAVKTRKTYLVLRILRWWCRLWFLSLKITKLYGKKMR